MSKLCKECGHQMDDNLQVCPNCGRPAENVEVKNRANVFNLPKVLMIVLCVYAVLHILFNIERIFVFGNYEGFNMFESIVLIATNVLILIDALLYNKHKNAYYGMVVGFCVIIIMTIFNMVSMMSYSNGSNEVTKDVIDTARVSVQTEEITQNKDVKITEEELTSEQKEEIANKRIIGTYTFGDGYEKWQITFNDDGTCTMFEKKTSEYLWHGSWKYYDYSNHYIVNWSSCDNPLLHLPFTSNGNYIDKEVKYMYAGLSEIDAKDPNGRYELRK